MRVRREVTASNRWEVRKCGRVRSGKEGGVGGRKRGREDSERGEGEKVKWKEWETGKDGYVGERKCRLSTGRDDDDAVDADAQRGTCESCKYLRVCPTGRTCK